MRIDLGVLTTHCARGSFARRLEAIAVAPMRGPAALPDHLAP